jgi:hypothetical protein
MSVRRKLVNAQRGATPKSHSPNHFSKKSKSRGASPAAKYISEDRCLLVAAVLNSIPRLAVVLDCFVEATVCRISITLRQVSQSFVDLLRINP